MKPPAIRPPEDVVEEIKEARTTHAKVWRRKGENKKRVSVSLGYRHYHDGTRMRDIDTRWEETGGKILLRKTPFITELQQGAIGLKYTSRSGYGDVNVTLNQIAGRSNFRIDPIVRDDFVIYREVQPGVDILLEARPGGVEFFKKIKNGTAARNFRWLYSEGDVTKIRVNRRHIGWDNEDRNHPTRDKNRRWKAELSRGTQSIDSINGRNEYYFFEEFKGRVRERDRTTRIPEWSTAVQYPVMVDADIDESVTVGTDDGWQNETGTTWAHSPAQGNYSLKFGKQSQSGITYVMGGARFQGVPSVGQGDTIDATTIFRGYTYYYAVVNAEIWGLDESDADADAFSDSNLPISRYGTEKTSASTTWTTPSATDTWSEPNVQSIVQELVNNANWAAGQDMAFVFTREPGGGTPNYRIASFGDYDTGLSGPVCELDIDFTAGGGGGVDLAERGVMRGVGRGVMRGN